MDTRLSRACVSLIQANPDRSGIVPLADGHDAFAVRALLADAADRTLDVRYYIWHHDRSGSMLFAALRRAADRGVRVRLLLDDNNTAGADGVLAALAAHPNIEVRLFNPFRVRRWRWLAYLTDFRRLNRRMHNKSFTADGQATIVGGRNVGDEYFDTGQAPWFVDLDVLAIGPVVQDVSRDFERYWTSDSAIPAGRVLARDTAAPVDSAPPTAAAEYIAAISRSRVVRDLLAQRQTFEWSPTRMLSDDPAKGLGRAPEESLLWHRLKDSLGTPHRELQVVSPYFVPGDTGVEALTELARHGVKVTVLTNALEATDVAAVHAGYAKRRRSLLAAGVELFELKRAARETSRRTARFGRFGSGSSASSLHAKTFGVDRARVFVGSFNFDPRSARLNTEMGFVIESGAMANVMAERFAAEIPAGAYQVRLDERGAMRWVERQDESTVTHETEPGTTWGRRLTVALLSLLPIEWLL